MDEGGAFEGGAEERDLGGRGGAAAHALDDSDEDVRLQQALWQRLDEHLGDDACRLVARDELAHYLGQRHDGEQAEGLEEHLWRVVSIR